MTSYTELVDAFRNLLNQLEADFDMRGDERITEALSQSYALAKHALDTAPVDAIAAVINEAAP